MNSQHPTSYLTSIQYMDLSAKNYFRSGRIFQSGGHRHLGYLKFPNVKGRKGQEDQCPSLCHILWQSAKPLLRYIHAPKIVVLPEKWELGPYLTLCRLAEAYLCTKCHLDS